MADPGVDFCEDELLPLSSLQHLMFCERQCALIHVQVWPDNRLGVENATGAQSYGTTRRREDVACDEGLRADN